MNFIIEPVTPTAAGGVFPDDLFICRETLSPERPGFFTPPRWRPVPDPPGMSVLPDWWPERVVPRRLQVRDIRLEMPEAEHVRNAALKCQLFVLDKMAKLDLKDKKRTGPVEGCPLQIIIPVLII